jgi:hypothetical protein
VKRRTSRADKLSVPLAKSAVPVASPSNHVTEQSETPPAEIGRGGPNKATQGLPAQSALLTQDSNVNKHRRPWLGPASSHVVSTLQSHVATQEPEPHCLSSVQTLASVVQWRTTLRSKSRPANPD